MPQEMARARTLLHEVAHAWIDQNVSQGQLDDFMQLRGLAAWDRDASWGDLGAEHAAEILLWGLTDGAHNINVQIDGSDDAELAQAYRILTQS